jgi:hypothetical protein
MPTEKELLDQKKEPVKTISSLLPVLFKNPHLKVKYDYSIENEGESTIVRMIVKT